MSPLSDAPPAATTSTTDATPVLKRSMSPGAIAANARAALGRYGLLGLVAMLAAFFSVLPASAAAFPSRANLNNILGDQTVVTIGALALVVTMVCGHFDITVGSVIGLSSIASAAAMSRYGLSLPAAAAIGVVVGAAVGMINGCLVAYLRLNSIIVTLAGTIVISGVVQWYTEGLTINTHISKTLTDFGSGFWLSVPQPALLLLLVALLIWYLLDHTPFGRRLYMIGDSPQAAHLVGVTVERHVLAAFTLGGGLAGLAGVVLTARSGGANPQDGPGYLFPALAAAFLSITAIKPGRFNVWGSVVAVFFVAVAVSGLSIAGAQPWVQPVFNGTALLIAVTLTTAAQRGQAREVTR